MDGGQPSSATDLVEWRLYLDGANEPSEEALQRVLAACTAQVAPLLRGYIWQSDPFTLRVLADQRGDAPRCLGGSAHVGESLEDEWLLAWLCFRLTRAVAGLTARVWDSDGEFLLIEAAYSLPKWARRPEATDHRVFIRGGQLRMLSPAACLGEGWSLRRGLQAVAALPDEQTLAPAGVRQCLDTAMEGFPERCGANMHTTRCRLPARVAALLRAEPQLVAPAVVMFHERDPSDVAAAARMTFFPYTEMVTVAVRFTRMLYAQLAQQEFHPPRNAPPVPPESHSGHGAAVLGVKLTAGFEMLAAHWAREGMPLPGPGYTGGGGDAAGTDAASGEADNDVAIACRAAAILRACPDPAASEFGPDPGPAADDSDEWLSQGEALLDHALRQREEERQGGAAAASGQGAGGGGSEPEVAAAARQVDAAVRGVRAFLAAQGGVDGVTVPTGNGGPGLSVDPSSFLRELSQALGVAVDGLADGEGHSSEDDLSDDEDGDGDSDISDDEEVHVAAAAHARGQPQGGGTRWRVMEGPDSDDEEDDEDEDGSSESDGDAEAQRGGFHAQYAAVLQQQLRETALGEDFARSGEEMRDAAQQPPAADLAPLDVDLNLVQSLLASYAAQGGHPGPASNLLSMLGLGMPDTADLREPAPRRAEQTAGASEE